MFKHSDTEPARPNFYAKLAMLGQTGGEQVETGTLKNIGLFQKLDLQRQLEEDYRDGRCDRNGNYYPDGGK